MNSSTPTTSHKMLQTAPRAWLPVFCARALQRAPQEPITPDSITKCNPKKIRINPEKKFLRVWYSKNCYFGWLTENDVQKHVNGLTSELDARWAEVHAYLNCLGGDISYLAEIARGSLVGVYRGLVQKADRKGLSQQKSADNERCTLKWKCRQNFKVLWLIAQNFFPDCFNKSCIRYFYFSFIFIF